jgi:hypothetical protein
VSGVSIAGLPAECVTKRKIIKKPTAKLISARGKKKKVAEEILSDGVNVNQSGLNQLL